jgi:hypothetical protein
MYSRGAACPRPGVLSGTQKWGRSHDYLMQTIMQRAKKDDMIHMRPCVCNENTVFGV